MEDDVCEFVVFFEIAFPFKKQEDKNSFKSDIEWALFLTFSN